LRGKGVPRLRSATRGDLHVHIDVRTPTRLDEAQAKLLRDLAELRNEEISVTGNRGGLFAKVRDAFNGR
jgi:molecular chaperone DnaJ